MNLIGLATPWDLSLPNGDIEILAAGTPPETNRFYKIIPFDGFCKSLIKFGNTV